MAGAQVPVGATHLWRLAVRRDGPACGALLCFPLDASPAEHAQLAALLSPEERERASRFLVPGLAGRYTVAHGRVRQLLAPLVGLPPERIEFTTGPHGKPTLAGTAAASGIHFNLSHSDDLGLAGWAMQREIGVDIERWRATRDEGALVRRFFSPHEIAAYQALPLERRTEGFFNCWTRKEAYVKAVGRGLGLALDSFDVALDSGPDARLLRASALCNDGRHWSLAAPQAMAGVSVAVVLEAEDLQLHASEIA